MRAVAGVTAVWDTSVLIGLETGRIAPEALESGRLGDSPAISSVVVEELQLGVLQSPTSVQESRRETLRQALAHYDVVAVSRDIALACAEIRAEGRRRGRRYDPFDSLVGATGRVLGLPVLTQDRGFEGMAGVDVRLV